MRDRAFDALLSGLRADLAHGEAQNAAGNIALTMGYGPLPDTVDSLDVKIVAQRIREREQGRINGKLHTAANNAPAAAH